MSLWIKICGNTSLADAELAADAGADAVGFVFAPSPRRVTVADAAGIAPKLPKNLEKIGVFVDTLAEEVAAAIRAANLTGVQLHHGIDAQAAAQLRAEFGPALRILRVIHFGAGLETAAATQAATLAADPAIDALLIDSRTATQLGGTGIAFDWAKARAKLFQNAEARKRLVAAGGLTPANIAEAIRALHPWGVDAVSGVEAAPGRKDPAKFRAFVENAREAARAAY